MVVQIAVTPGLRSAFELIDLPYEKVITRAELEAALRDQNAVRKRWAERMLPRLDAGEKFSATYPYPLHAWRLGKEMLVVGMGATLAFVFLWIVRRSSTFPNRDPRLLESLHIVN